MVFGGWPFILNTAQMNPFLLLIPAWISAIIVPIALLGLLRGGKLFEIRISCIVFLYMAAFCVVGRPFNDYWGLIYSSLMLLGLLHAPGRIKLLLSEIRKKGG